MFFTKGEQRQRCHHDWQPIIDYWTGCHGPDNIASSFGIVYISILQKYKDNCVDSLHHLHSLCAITLNEESEHYKNNDLEDSRRDYSYITYTYILYVFYTSFSPGTQPKNVPFWRHNIFNDVFWRHTLAKIKPKCHSANFWIDALAVFN